MAYCTIVSHAHRALLYYRCPAHLVVSGYLWVITTWLCADCSHADCVSVAMQLQQQLAEIAARVESGEFFYTRFFAIGVFRILELTETRDPKALEGLIKVCPLPC